jgi:hypothetical protein
MALASSARPDSPPAHPSCSPSYVTPSNAALALGESHRDVPLFEEVVCLRPRQPRTLQQGAVHGPVVALQPEVSAHDGLLRCGSVWMGFPLSLWSVVLGRAFESGPIVLASIGGPKRTLRVSVADMVGRAVLAFWLGPFLWGLMAVWLRHYVSDRSAATLAIVLWLATPVALLALPESSRRRGAVWDTLLGRPLRELKRRLKGNLVFTRSQAQRLLVGAVEQGDEYLVAVALRRGADANEPDQGGKTPLVMASQGRQYMESWIEGYKYSFHFCDPEVLTVLLKTGPSEENLREALSAAHEEVRSGSDRDGGETVENTRAVQLLQEHMAKRGFALPRRSNG